VNGQVSDIENRLREAYRVAADTIQPDGIRTLYEPVTVIAPGRSRSRRPRRAPRGRVLLPLAAAAAIVAIVAGVPALLSGLPSAAPRPTGQAGRTGQAPGTAPAAARTRTSTLAVPPGAPPYFVALSGGANTSLYVYRTGIADPLLVVPVPHAGDSFYAVAATADPRTYVVATGHAYTCGTHLYALHLWSGSSPAYTPLPVPTLPEDVFALTVTPDARFLGYAGEYCDSPDGGTGDIGFVNLATGGISRWTAPGNEDIGSLSLSANGTQIGFVVQQTKLYQPLAGILPTDAPAGTIAQRAQVVVAQRLVVAGHQLTLAGAVPDAAALAPDGRTLYVCGASESAAHDPLLTVSGGTVTGRTALAGSGPCVLSLDPSGGFLLAQTSITAGHAAAVLELIDLATGTVTPLPAQGIGAQNDVWVTW